MSSSTAPPRFDPAVMALRGRVGAYTVHASYDPKVTTGPARAAFRAKFEHEVDPDNVLSPAERQRRGAMAYKAHMARLALKAAKARAEQAARGRR